MHGLDPPHPVPVTDVSTQSRHGPGWFANVNGGLPVLTATWSGRVLTVEVGRRGSTLVADAVSGTDVCTLSIKVDSPVGAWIVGAHGLTSLARRWRRSAR